MAKGNKNEKTNAMRLLDTLGVAYDTVTYSIPDEEFSGSAVARLVGTEPDSCLKTLCALGKNGQPLVFLVPVDETLDLKKGARAAGEKSVELCPQKLLRDLTGYERGGVSPLGMKKKYPVYIEETAQLFDRVQISGGRKGLALLLSPQDLLAASEGNFVPLL